MDKDYHVKHQPKFTIYRTEDLVYKDGTVLARIQPANHGERAVFVWRNADQSRDPTKFPSKSQAIRALIAHHRKELADAEAT